jgi:hypothetical protein
MIDQNRLTLAVLAACTIRALGDANPDFAIRLKANLAQVEELLRNSGPDYVGALETLEWVSELTNALGDGAEQPATPPVPRVAAE